jgi:peptidoglycan/LPS O-acetylase OafA/YrhL
MSVLRTEVRSRPYSAPLAQRLPRLPSITGLRFIAAFGVFGYHVLTLLPSWTLLHPLLMSGQAGVSFFFILSGFVLTWSDRPADSRGAFWQRRAARILPSQLATWLVALPVSALRFGAWPHLWPMLATLTLTQSWVPAQDVFFGVNGVAWSLSCEAFFYALFPALIPLVRAASSRRRVELLFGCLVLLAAIQLVGWRLAGGGISDPSGMAFWLVSVLPLSRLPEFVVGMVAAQAIRAGQRPPIRLVPAAVLSLFAGYLAGLFPTSVVAGWLTLVPFTLLICAAAQNDLRGCSGLLARRWAVRLGEWSFAFYLTHQLVLRTVGACWPAGKFALLQVCIDLVLALAASAALYHWVEVPAERRLRPRAVPASGVTSSTPAPAAQPRLLVEKVSQLPGSPVE